jgi:hypothetical protein
MTNTLKHLASILHKTISIHEVTTLHFIKIKYDLMAGKHGHLSAVCRLQYDSNY